ncbi:MAG TPA: polyprenyl synthetase family protein [Planctomycetota bacterium]|jgi:geranylgeranyl pyrophosphate synthase|nr:polyprenyl synthetase family protein [Planctomycetota bacterium]
MTPHDGATSGNGHGVPVTLRFGPRAGVTLPPMVPRQRYRPAQSNIPDDKRVRSLLMRAAIDHVRRTGAVPPIPLAELRERSATVLRETGTDPKYADFVAVLLSNAAWRDSLARIPYDRRLLLLPKCLRVEEKCPAPFDEFGLLCKECGLCSIQDLSVEAERLGYAVLVAEGSALVRQLIETGKIEAIVGVSCLNVLERSFPHVEAAAIPAVAIPLLQDDCVNTTVDLDWVWEYIHLTSADKTYRLDLDALKEEVGGWFAPGALEELLGPAADETSRIARAWLAKAGKRWRPYLAACAYLALQSDRRDEPPPRPPDLRKLAVAVECFHKASLIHDDIEDGDDLRYGEPALHAETGVPVALNVGDFLLGEGYRLLSELSVEPAVRVDMLRAAAEGHRTLSLGQGAELLWMRRPEPPASLEVLEIFRQKTAPAFEVALRLGALLAGADAETHEALRTYSESLGIAYQIRDDLEDWRTEGDASDLERRRPSLILAIAHKRAGPGRERDVVEALIRGRARPAEVASELRAILQERGVLEKAEELLEAYKEQAVRSLRFLSNATLKGLLRRVVGKIFGERLIEGYCKEFEARNAGRPS